MARMRPRRIGRFVADLRVEPGRKVRLPRDFDPAMDDAQHQPI